MNDIKELEQILKFNKKPLLAILDVLNDLNKNVVESKVELPEQKDSVKISNVNEITGSIEEMTNMLNKHIEKTDDNKKGILGMFRGKTDKEASVLLKALKSIENRIPTISDYTGQLNEMINLLDKEEKEIDLSKIEKELKVISKSLTKEVKETEIIPEYLLHSDGLKVKLYKGDIKELSKAMSVQISSGGLSVGNYDKGVKRITSKLDNLIGMEIPPYDYIDLSYTGDDLTGVVYKTGGSGGTTVATLILAYTAGVLQTITKV